jgi:hypothetical protein
VTNELAVNKNISMAKMVATTDPKTPVSTKWHSGLDAADLGELSRIAREIDNTVDTTVKHVARAKIKLGKLLLEAREKFNQDQQFGQWRKQATCIKSKQHAHYLMQIAKRFADAPKLIESANYSTLQELVTADDEAVEWVQERINRGEPPTVAEVREKVKELKGTSKKGQSIVPTSGPANPNQSVNEIVQMTLTQRIQRVVGRGIKDITGDYLILGIDPDPQTPMHPLCLEAVYDCWLERCENDDEKRAVKDSYNRVKLEFKAWE